MNKKIVTLMILMIIGTVYAQAAVFEIENETYKFQVTMINQEPDPVTPGNTFDVRFRIENRKSEAVNNVEVKVVPKFPFSMYRQDEAIKSIGTLAPNQVDETGVRVKFKLVADENAAEGENEIEFFYRENGGAWVKAGDFTIDIRTRDAVLAINEVKTDKERIAPGTITKVTFILDNLADNLLKDVKLKLDVYNQYVASATETFNELPFSPIGSGNEKTVDKIQSKRSNEISFNLFTDADAESKVYKVPYTLTYSDETGANFTRTGIVGLMVDVEPIVSYNIDTTDIYSKGSKGNVQIKFVNKGFSDVKFLDVILEETSDFDLLSNPEVYIGNVDSDDYETAEYSIYVKSDARNPVNLPLMVEYRDANGKLYSKKSIIKLELFEGDELKQRVGNGGNPFVGVIVVLVIVGLGIFIYRRRKKKKKLHK